MAWLLHPNPIKNTINIGKAQLGSLNGSDIATDIVISISKSLICIETRVFYVTEGVSVIFNTVIITDY